MLCNVFNSLNQSRSTSFSPLHFIHNGHLFLKVQTIKWMCSKVSKKLKIGIPNWMTVVTKHRATDSNILSLPMKWYFSSSLHQQCGPIPPADKKIKPYSYCSKVTCPSVHLTGNPEHSDALSDRRWRCISSSDCTAVTSTPSRMLSWMQIHSVKCHYNNRLRAKQEPLLQC